MNFFGAIARKTRKTLHVVKSRKIVRLIGLSSVNPIFIKGKAKAQKIIGSKIIKKKYFLANDFFVSGNCIMGCGGQKNSII